MKCRSRVALAGLAITLWAGAGRADADPAAAPIPPLCETPAPCPLVEKVQSDIDGFVNCVDFIDPSMPVEHQVDALNACSEVFLGPTR